MHYLIMVFAVFIAAVQLPAQPANDHFHNAIPLNSASGEVTGSLTQATREDGEPNTYDRTLWYTFTPNTSGTLFMELMSGSIFYTGGGIKIFMGTTLENLRQSPDSEGCCQRVCAKITNATPFSISIGDRNMISDDFTFAWRFIACPQNDNFADRIPLFSFPTNLTVSTLLATLQPGETNHASSTTRASVWYEWIAPMDGWLIASQPPSKSNSFNFVYQGNTFSNLVRLPLKWSGGSNATNAYYRVNQGQSYQIAFVSYSYSHEPCTVMGSTFPVYFDFSTVELSAPVEAKQYRWQEPIPFQLNAPTEAVDGKLIGASFWVSSYYVDSFLGSTTNFATPMTFSNFTAGYHWAWAIATNQSGEIHYAPAVPFEVLPGNDYFTNRLNLVGTQIDAQGSLSGTAVQPDEPVPGGLRDGSSVWFSWVAPMHGFVEALVNPGYFDTSLAVFEGSQIANLRLLDYSFYGGFNICQFPVIAQQEYNFLVYSTVTNEAPTVRLMFTLDPTPNAFSLRLQPTSTNTLQYTILGMGGRETRLQSSTNLSDWTEEEIIGAGFSQYESVIPAPVDAPARFYRALVY